MLLKTFIEIPHLKTKTGIFISIVPIKFNGIGSISHDTG